MTIFIPPLAEGFATQQGAILSFSDKAEEANGHVLQISTADEPKWQKNKPNSDT